ncbi:MAG: preprotein translocase subunit SecE [Alphaproteobacteria bacterium]
MAKTNTTKTKSAKTEKGAKAAPPKEKKVAQAGAKLPTAEASEADAPARPRVGPFKFLQQVNQEVRKVTWPTWKETYVTTIMVFVMVILCALFFLLVDEVLGNAVSYLLKLAS